MQASILCIYADLRPTKHFYYRVFTYFSNYGLSVYVNGSLAHKNTPNSKYTTKKVVLVMNLNLYLYFLQKTNVVLKFFGKNMNWVYNSEFD